MPDLYPYVDCVSDIDNLIIATADSWGNSMLRPKLALNTALHWDRMIEEWMNDETLPIYVRKMSRNRGQKIKHNSGRILVPADNSPANWSFSSAFSDLRPTLAEIKVLIENDEIPVAMAMSRLERQAAHFRCTRSSVRNPNQLNWKVCHKRPFALQAHGEITEMPISIIQRHFRYFISPLNLFLIPKKMSGLGEVPLFLEAMQGYY
jgi:hypothetical protein